MDNQDNSKSPHTEKRKKVWKYITNALLLVIVIILIIPSFRKKFQIWYTQLTLTEVTFESLDESKQMPLEEQNWAIFNHEGNMINFAESKGKPIVISFWASWCFYCKAAFPDLESLRNKFNQEIAFFAVTTEPLEVLQTEKKKYDYDFLYCSQSYPSFFNVSVFPTLIVLDKNMNLVYKLEGAGDVDNEENEQFLRELL